MRQPSRPWVPDDITRMLHMREVERRKWTEIDRELGRPAGSSAAKYESLRRERDPVHPKDAGGRVEVSNKQEIERLARKAAEQRRDITGEFFGDPPPGFSALDRRKSACGGTGPGSGTGTHS